MAEKETEMLAWLIVRWLWPGMLQIGGMATGLRV